jgi:hypothetical protein
LLREVVGDLAIDGPEDLAEILAELDVSEQPPAPLQLLGLARFVSSVGGGGPRAPGALTGLAALVADARSFIAETQACRAVQPSGDVSDDASPALREIATRCGGSAPN